MEKEFVPYEQVSSLIALGFNEPVIAHRQNGLDICLLKQPEVLFTDLSMILYQQAFRWFRENYGVHASPRKYDETKWGVEWGTWTSPAFETFEEAELSWLNKLLEIVESKSE